MTTPRKIGGTGPFRHCYPGQEAKLHALLVERGVDIKQFNAYRDRIEQQNHNHELSQDEHDPEYRKAVAERIQRILQDAKTSEPPPHAYNLFVPTTAPRYQEMLDQGGIPGTSLEDPSRHGVWVPLEWHQSHQQK